MLQGSTKEGNEYHQAFSDHRRGDARFTHHVFALVLSGSDHYHILCCATANDGKLDQASWYGHSLKSAAFLFSICLSHQMKFVSIASPPKLSNGGHFTTRSRLHSPFQIIVVISEIESLDYLPGYDGLGRIWWAINSREVWYGLLWLHLLISWHHCF